MDELKEVLRKNDAHLPLDNLISTASERLKVFATNIVDTFLDTFGYKKSDLDKVFLYVDDFVCSFLATIHGVALQDMQEYIKRTFGVDGIWRVVVGYEPSITVVADDLKVYKKLLQKKDQIEKKAYAIMKQHDRFDLLTQQDVPILITCMDRVEIRFHLKKDLGTLQKL